MGMTHGLSHSPLSGPPLIFDGGLGTRLADRGNDVTGALWSAEILRDTPAEVQAAHEDFFRAGADVATTCSYQVTFETLGDEAEDLLRRSVDLALRAADAVRAEEGGARPLYVAASVGPYGAGPGEGTEYDGAYDVDKRGLVDFHRRRIEVLADTDADFLLAETVPSIDEVEVLIELLGETGRPFALSVTGVLAESQRLVDKLAALVRDNPALGAVGVNCCSVDTARKVVRQLSGSVDVPVFAYPNSGEQWDHQARVWRPEPDGSVGAVAGAPLLIADGARHVGGCCRVTPEQIQTIRTEQQTFAQ